MSHEEVIAAIKDRHAVRKYLDRAIPGEVRSVLDVEIERCNTDSGLSIRAFYDEPEGFQGGRTHYGNLRGVQNYFALVGQTGTDLDIDCGYYGQRLVILAQHLGLNTCWVGLSYNKTKVRSQMDSDEKLALVVALGYGENPGKPHPSKPVEKLGRVRVSDQMPPWFLAGLEMAALAPTALNQQKFSFDLEDNKVRAHKGIGSYTAVDLGIAQFHFEIGAAGAQWNWA
ncbi:MAG: hypothetical protein FWD55_06450 [Propionibacteriaceae bacterium]|nr:hypothetical protein [Propionibacteriaceae bacterium]